MNTKRTKRWNGDPSTLSADYLKNVIEKMLAYGEQAQFSDKGTLQGPNYQIINAAGKKIAFNSNNLLIQTEDDDFSGSVAAPVYSLEQVRTLLTQLNSPLAKVARTKRVASGAKTPAAPRGGTALAKAKELIALQKYDYYKTHRATLPPDIREHSEEITRLMESGISAEVAFNEAAKLCYVH